MSKIRPVLLVNGQGEPIQDVFKPEVAQRVILSGLPEVRNTTDFTSMVIEVTPTVACAFKLGDSSVIAKSGEDFYMAPNIPHKLNIGENTRIGAQATVSGEIGILHVTELS